MAKSVTYEGPVEEGDPTTRYVVDGVKFPLGTAVHDVSDEVVKRLEADEGHEFTIGTKAAAEKAATAAAEDAAADTGDGEE